MNILEYYIKVSNVLTKARQGTLTLTDASTKLEEINAVARETELLQEFVAAEGFWTPVKIDAALFAANSIVSPPTRRSSRSNEDGDFYDDDDGDYYDE